MKWTKLINADIFARNVDRNFEEFEFNTLGQMISFIEQHGTTFVNIHIQQSSKTPQKYKLSGTFLTDEEIEKLEENDEDYIGNEL